MDKGGTEGSDCPQESDIRVEIKLAGGGVEAQSLPSYSRHRKLRIERRAKLCCLLAGAALLVGSCLLLYRFIGYESKHHFAPMAPPTPAPALPTPPTGIVVRGRTISANYTFPQNKQSINDQRYFDKFGLLHDSNASAMAARYRRLAQDIQPGVRRYNTFWTAFEATSVKPSTSPVTCPGGYSMVPANEEQRVGLGYHMFHCYSEYTTSMYEKYLQADARIGAESVAIIWGSELLPLLLHFLAQMSCTNSLCAAESAQNRQDAVCSARNELQCWWILSVRTSDVFGGCAFPTIDNLFKYPACNGSSGGSGSESDLSVSAASAVLGCVPRDDSDAMDAYEDFVNFLSEHYSPIGTGFRHFIIWNEMASGDWFNYEPEIDQRQGPSNADTARWLDKIADMMTRAHAAIQRHYLSPTMLYLSLDQTWARPPHCPPTAPFHSCDIGTLTVIRGMWERLGDMDWSVAIHPYGDPLQPRFPSAFTFADICNISNYLVELARAGGAERPELAPQAMMAATEQGWKANGTLAADAAHNICIAHELALANDNMTWVAHNDFQGLSAEDPTGLVPVSAGAELENAGSLLTYAAYKSSHPQSWGLTLAHYCCQTWGLGCPVAAALGSN